MTRQGTDALSRGGAVDFENDFTSLLPSHGPCTSTVRELAQRRGLSLSLLTLLQALGGRDETFIIDSLAVAPVGADADRVASLWVIRFWDFLAGNLKEPCLVGAATSIVALHRRVVEGELVCAGEWRLVRNGFSRALAVEACPSEVSTAWVIGALAWDLNGVPGALTDAIFQIKQLAEDKWRLDAGWTQADDDFTEQVALAAMEYASRTAGVPKRDDDAWYASPEGIEFEIVFEDAFYAYYEQHAQRAVELHNGVESWHEVLSGQAMSALHEAMMELRRTEKAPRK